MTIYVHLDSAIWKIDKVHEILMHGHQTRINHDNIKSVDGFWAGIVIKNINVSIVWKFNMKYIRYMNEIKIWQRVHGCLKSNHSHD